MASEPKIAIVGVRNIFGKTLKEVLERSKFPIKDAYLYEPGAKEYALIDSFRDEARVVTQPRKEELERRDLVFFTVRVENELFEAPGISVDLSGTREELPVYLEGITERIREKRFANPHPAAVGIATLLSSLPWKPSAASFIVFEPVSSLGEEAMDELFSQAISVLNMEDVPQKKLGDILAFDLFPKRGKRGKGRFTKEELKISRHIEKLLGIKSEAIILRTGVFHRYSVLINLRFSKGTPSIKAFEEALEDNPSVLLEKKPFSPAKIEDEEGFFVYAGEIRKGNGGNLWLWTVFDNLKKPAFNAISIGFRALRDE